MKKKRGRPAIGDPSVSVHFRLPAKDYDVTLAHAKDARVDLADYIRRALKIANTKPTPWT